MILIIRLLLLPIRLAFGITGLGFKAGYRTGRLLGYRRMFVFGAGVAVGLLIAPGPGTELRERLRRRMNGGGSADPELADRVRFELRHSPNTSTLPQPEIDVVAGRVILRGEVTAEGRDVLAAAAASVPGVSGVDNLLAVTGAGSGDGHHKA